MAPSKPVQKKVFKTGIRNLVTRSNVVKLIMIAAFVLQLVSMILSLTDNRNRGKINDLGKTIDEYGGNLDDKMFSVFKLLGPIIIFSCMVLHMVTKFADNKTLHIASTLLLFIITCWTAVYTLRPQRLRREGTGTALASEVTHLLSGNVIVSLVYSVLQFLAILRP